MIKEKLNMELRARILIIISISSLLLYLSVEGLNILPPIAQPKSKLDQGSPVLEESKHSPSPTLLLGGITEVLEKAEKKIAPVTSSIVNEAESVLGRETKTSIPVPAPFLGPNFPISSSPRSTPLPFSSPSLSPVSYVSQPPFSPVPSIGIPPSPFSEPAPYQDPPSSSPGPGSGPSPSGFIDHDVALAIESRIKQSQSDAQLAMDEGKKLLDDPTIATSETGVCLSKCIDKYGASLIELNRAIVDLGVRDVTLLADDFSAVETDISTCQACFSENIGEDSPLKGLEEATTKAARECLTVMDYAA